MHSQTPLFSATEQRVKHTRTANTFHLVGIKYGHLVYRFRRLIIACWLIGLIVSIPFARIAPTVLLNSGYVLSGSESERVDRLLVDKLHHPATQVVVVFQSTTTQVSAPTYQQEVRDFMARAKTFPHVISVVQADKQEAQSTFVAVGFDEGKDIIAQRIPDFRTLLRASKRNVPARAYLTGDAVVANEIQLDTQSDSEHAEAIAMPIALVVLLIVFGTLVAGVMPLLMAIVVVLVALAVIYAIAIHIETNIFVLNVVSIIGLGLSIDYSLFITRRFREELAQGRSVSEAVAWTIVTAGEAILFSGITVIIGFAGLLFIGIQIMTSFGIGGITVSTAAVLAALTLLPALLSVVGTRINALRLTILFCPIEALSRLIHRRGSITGDGQSFWSRWARMVMQRPVIIVVIVTIILLGLGWPALSLHPGLPGASSLPANSEARSGLTILDTQFPNISRDPIYLIVQTRDGSPILAPQNLARLDTLTHWVTTQPHVKQVIGLTSPPKMSGQTLPTLQQLTMIYSSGVYLQQPALAQLASETTVDDTTLLTVTSDAQTNSRAREVLMDDLRKVDQHTAQGLSILVGGANAINLDFDRALYGNFLRTLLFILIATYILLLFIFHSLLLPLKAVLMNVLSISAAYGAIVFVFQQGNFERLLGFTSDGSIDRFIPILLFCTLFGLSMDYEVFLLSRIREEWLSLQDNRDAVVRGLEKTGGVITNAALLFVIVSGAFTFTSLIVTKELGLGITVAVLVDATIIRALLVPATMQLLGRWNWWFPRLARS